MKFNSKTKEKTRLLNLIKYATQDKKYELEAIIQRGYNNKPISYIDFILKSLNQYRANSRFLIFYSKFF